MARLYDSGEGKEQVAIRGNVYPRHMVSEDKELLLKIINVFFKTALFFNRFAGDKFELTRIGRRLQAIVMFLYAVITGDIGGSLLFTAMFLIYAAFSFFTTESLEFMNVFTDGAREYGKYPLEVYGKRLLWITTFLIPYALVQYSPLLYLLERKESKIYIFLPMVVALFLLPAYLFWRIGIRHYKSCES